VVIALGAQREFGMGSAPGPRCHVHGDQAEMLGGLAQLDVRHQRLQVLVVDFPLLVGEFLEARETRD
jgi:hypothetical protein